MSVGAFELFIEFFDGSNLEKKRRRESVRVKGERRPSKSVLDSPDVPNEYRVENTRRRRKNLSEWDPYPVMRQRQSRKSGPFKRLGPTSVIHLRQKSSPPASLVPSPVNSFSTPWDKRDAPALSPKLTAVNRIYFTAAEKAWTRRRLDGGTPAASLDWLHFQWILSCLVFSNLRKITTVLH